MKFDPDNLKKSLVENESIRDLIPTVARMAGEARLYDESRPAILQSAEYLAMCQAELSGCQDQSRRLQLLIRVEAIKQFQSSLPELCANLREHSRILNHEASWGMTMLIDRCIRLAESWRQILPSKEVIAFCDNLKTMQSNQSLAVKFFGLSDFFKPTILLGIEP